MNDEIKIDKDFKDAFNLGYELAKELNITQSSVSQRIKRSNFDLILETDLYFRKKITEL